MALLKKSWIYKNGSKIILNKFSPWKITKAIKWNYAKAFRDFLVFLLHDVTLKLVMNKNHCHVSPCTIFVFLFFQKKTVNPSKFKNIIIVIKQFWSNENAYKNTWLFTYSNSVMCLSKRTKVETKEAFIK